MEAGACELIVNADPVGLAVEPEEVPKPSFALASPGRAH